MCVRECVCGFTTVRDVDMALLTHLKKSMVESNFYGELCRAGISAGCVCVSGGREAAYKMNSASSSVSSGLTYLLLNQVFIVSAAA